MLAKGTNLEHLNLYCLEKGQIQSILICPTLKKTNLNYQNLSFMPVGQIQSFWRKDKFSPSKFVPPEKGQIQNSESVSFLRKTNLEHLNLSKLQKDKFRPSKFVQFSCGDIFRWSKFVLATQKAIWNCPGSKFTSGFVHFKKSWLKLSILKSQKYKT